jgi:hypothetical protein
MSDLSNVFLGYNDGWMDTLLDVQGKRRLDMTVSTDTNFTLFLLIWKGAIYYYSLFAPTYPDRTFFIKDV